MGAAASTIALDRRAVRSLDSEQLARVLAFYASVGYGAPVAANDEIFMAVRSGEIIGAVRLCDEHGSRIPRGMYVQEGLRGEGTGQALLGALESRVRDLSETCYCLPYARLERFYGSAGFVRIEGASAPTFLSERLQCYMAKGTDEFIVMRRA